MEYLTPLWGHQCAAIEAARPLSEYALLMSPGTGKTCTAINILRHKCNDSRRNLRTLVLAPLIVLENWKREFALHSKIPQERIIILQGSAKKRVQLIEQHGFDGDGFPAGVIFVMNYEGLLMADVLAALERWCPEFMILDESHKCKDMKSKRTKAAVGLADRARYKLILTGTPVLNSPMDLFAQFRILDGGETFGKNFFAFRAMYFYDKNAGMPKQKYFPDWRIRPGSLELMNERIYRKAMRVTKEECLDLPDLVRQTIPVELSPAQKAAYESMKRDFIAFVNDKACVAELAITKALRLMQIASGYVKTTDGDETAFTATPKMEALKELLGDLTAAHKVIVWAVFRENFEQIKRVCEELGVKYVEVHGSISNKDKFANVDQFTQDPETRVFIGHPGAGGIGINLVQASYAIWYSRTFSLEQDLQAEARSHRGGSEIHAKVTRIDLVAKGTIDEVIAARLAQKLEISERILRQIADEI